MSKSKIILLVVILILAAIQFIPHERELVTINTAHDFRTDNTELKNILRKACYDCHSFETNYPWYANVVPVNYWLNNHINEGREHLNFSEWNAYPAGDQKHSAKEIVEVVEEKEMPMLSYWIVHWDAKLTDAERKVIIDAFGGSGAHDEEEDDDDH